MNNSIVSSGKLVWKDEYSVNVKELDDQHKNLIEIINNLIEVINAATKEETIVNIITKIVKYKAVHFATEEKYFHQFNYEGTVEHETAHQLFNKKVQEIQAKNKGNVVAFAYTLVDYLEDWLLDHLVTMDQKYKECFHDHGLR
jgi:hemerythrin